MNLDTIIAKVREICQKHGFDAEKEEKYLRHQLPHICGLHGLTLDHPRIAEWLNGFYLKCLAGQTQRFKDYAKRCRERYDAEVAALQARNDGTRVPISVFSFEHCYNGHLEKAISDIARSIGNIV